MTIRLASPEDLTGIHILQTAYHFSRIGRNPRSGFLTYSCDMNDLTKINAELGIIIALKSAEVIAYNMLMTVRRAKSTPIFDKMINAYVAARSSANLNRTVVSAQYCVREDCRGGEIIKSLYRFQRQFLMSRGYTISIGEIHKSNRISLISAKEILGYIEVTTYTSEDGEWVVMERNEDNN
jgi:hypothetical protein